MDWRSRLTERQIEKARLKGELSNLSGEGEPLPDRTGDAFTDPGMAAGFRIMAEAGALPEEIVLGRKIDALKREMRDILDPDKRKAAMAELARLEMKRAIAREARKKFIGS